MLQASNAEQPPDLDLDVRPSPRDFRELGAALNNLSPCAHTSFIFICLPFSARLDTCSALDRPSGVADMLNCEGSQSTVYARCQGAVMVCSVAVTCLEQSTLRSCERHQTSACCAVHDLNHGPWDGALIQTGLRLSLPTSACARRCRSLSKAMMT